MSKHRSTEAVLNSDDAVWIDRCGNVFRGSRSINPWEFGTYIDIGDLWEEDDD